MTEHVARFPLYEFLGMPDLPRLQWTIGSGWLMGEHIWDFVKKRMSEMIKAASFIALTADETTDIDSTSWIVIHVYIMQHWGVMSLIISLQKLESDRATVDNLTQTLMGALV